MLALQRYERSLRPITTAPRLPNVEWQEFALTWGDKVSATLPVRPIVGGIALGPDSRSPPNFARGSHDVQGKDSALVPRVEEHDLMMRRLGHTRSSDRAPHARSDLW